MTRKLKVLVSVDGFKNTLNVGRCFAWSDLYSDVLFTLTSGLDLNKYMSALVSSLCSFLISPKEKKTVYDWRDPFWQWTQANAKASKMSKVHDPRSCMTHSMSLASEVTYYSLQDNNNICYQNVCNCKTVISYNRYENESPSHLHHTFIFSKLQLTLRFKPLHMFIMDNLILFFRHIITQQTRPEVLK